MKNKILFVSPRKFLYSYPMLGMAFLSSYLKRYGRYQYDIRLADENTGSSWKDALNDFRPDIVSISSTTPQITYASRIAEYVKANFPGTLVLVGGPHPTVLPERTLDEFKAFDIVCVGEGEKTFKELVDSYFSGEKDFRNQLSRIKGIAYRDNGSVLINEPNELIEDIDSIPLPDRDLFDRNYYFSRPRQVIRGLSKRSTHLMSSRGCPYNCTYCSSSLMWKRKVRFHSKERVIQEVTELSDKFKLEAVFFEDDLFIADKNRAVSICEGLVSSGLSKKMQWACQLKSNLLKENDLGLLKLLKEAGCVQVEFGLESGSERFLKIIKRGTSTVDQNQFALDLAKKAGLRTVGNFIFGFHGETLEDMMKTKEFILKNYKTLDYYQALIATPYPATTFWDECVRDKVIGEINWDKFSMGVFDTELFSNTVTRSQVDQIISELNIEAFKKVTLKEKLTWLFTRLQDDPGYVFNTILKNIKLRFTKCAA
jgi:radical SAM superfamily enzyme YgiQ (UPF0313 family)